MYAHSLDSYVDLFQKSIEESRRHDDYIEEDISIETRCDDINRHHTLAIYQYTCRGLFEKDKLIFSLQLCFKIMEKEGKIPRAEFDFFCYGGVVVDRSLQRPNPSTDWLTEASWDSITELDKINGFSGLASSFEQMNRDWKAWFMSGQPEVQALPGEWDRKCTELQKMCILRSLRLDRILFAATYFISNHLGSEFASPPPFDLRAIYNMSAAIKPLIFVLSPGVDPTAQVFALAKEMNVEILNCALGQGQDVTAVRLVKEGLEHGKWVLLANCHLMLSWMPTLENLVEAFCSGETPPHPRFRLWLSSSPHPDFPLSILQRGLKITTEPPRGLRANLQTLYNVVSEEQFHRCQSEEKYRKLLFSLAWFHAILLERRKFKSLGFNIPYQFNESDFSICHDLIIVFLDEYEETPFDAMKYLIAEANYGGRVTDDWDRRLVNVYISQYFCDDAVEMDGFRLSELNDYYIPSETTLHGFKEYLKTLPSSDDPLAFGQHPNADINSQIEDANVLVSTLIKMQPKLVSTDGESNEDKLERQASDLLEQVPAVFDAEQVRSIVDARSDPDSLKTVLYQEVDRYNKLLEVLHRTLDGITKAVKGLVVVTVELEEVMEALLEFRVPNSWSNCYPSTKPLGSWFRDMLHRVAFFDSWIHKELPTSFWLPALTYPTGFLTALFQTSARKNGIAIDTLSWEFPVLDHNMPDSIHEHPKEGAYMYGMVLEGAQWSYEAEALTDPAPMQLFSAMPIVHFKPVEGKRKSNRVLYSCPIYMYPVRTGTRERPSFVVAAELSSGNQAPSFWTKRGVALLLSTGE
jgi:dynein heavy chain